MHLDALKEKALRLPLMPGVYLMKDKDGQIIYVGKAKKLKNRVTQYFQNTGSHSPKTRIMVSKMDDFDVIIAASEFEALVLECSLIKRHQPKYNILLKDDKGYPYIRLDVKAEYPTMKIVTKVSHDGAAYYGPYGSRSATQDMIDTVCSVLKLPNCSKQFPRELGKGRPCLNYHMQRCAGWCTGADTADLYRQQIRLLQQLLDGNYKAVYDSLRSQMLSASEALNFELAASLRDRMNAIELLGQKQLVTAVSLADTDVIGFAQSGSKCCFAVMHFRDGNLLGKDHEIISAPEDPKAAIASLISQYYLNRGYAPGWILVPFMPEDSLLIEQLLSSNFGKKTRIFVPQRGEKARLTKLAVQNAQEEADRVTERDERVRTAVTTLEKMLGITPIKRIESFDVSNISGTDNVAAMVVFVNGCPQKSNYRLFRIDSLGQQDDYGSMRQALTRRFERYLQSAKGFEQLPDLLLIDGGASHAAIAETVLSELNICVPVFGMVKDDRHRTRALITSDGREVSIDSQQSVFSLVGSIQEETHRSAISYHKKLRGKRLKYSQLDAIPGIGEKRKQELLRIYKSITAISNATLSDLQRHLPKNVAFQVYDFFRKKREG